MKPKIIVVGFFSTSDHELPVDNTQGAGTDPRVLLSFLGSMKGFELLPFFNA